VKWIVGCCYLKAQGRTYFENVGRAVKIVYVLHENNVEEGKLAPLEKK